MDGLRQQRSFVGKWGLWQSEQEGKLIMDEGEGGR